MKKRFITLGITLSLICTFLTACISKKDDTADDPYKDFKQVESSYGVKYKIPKSWIAVDSNSDDTSLYYKNELGNNDGLLSVVYHKFNGNVLDSKNIEKVKNGYFVVCAMSLSENDYSSDFNKIFESIKITSAYDTTEETTEEPTL